MKTLAPSASRWMPLARIGLAITLATSLAHVQAAPSDPAPAPAGGAPQADRLTPAKAPAKAPGADGRPKHHRKEVTKAPVQRPFYPSNPLPPVPQRP